MTKSQDIIKQIENNLKDTIAYGIAADCLQEEGNYFLAKAFKYCYENKIYPDYQQNLKFKYYFSSGIPGIFDFCKISKIKKVFCELNHSETFLGIMNNLAKICNNPMA